MSDLPFSEFREIDNLVFVSGQVHLKGDELIQGSIEEKTRVTMENVVRVLHDAGLTINDVIKVDIYLTNIDDFSKVNPVYISFFEKPYPARVTLGVAALPLGADIEISVVAQKSQK